MNNSFALAMRQALEPLHVITYFSSTCVDDRKSLGLRGYWMGYFGSRAAPLGAVGPGVVEAVFYNFHPRMVRRAVPDAWTFAAPEAIVADRSRSATAVLLRLAPDIEQVAARVTPRLHAAIAEAPSSGRPLFAANRDVLEPDTPVAALWQAATTLRELRGDGHFACLLAEGIDGCEAHVLASAEAGISPEFWFATRGWSQTDWHAAQLRLSERGLMSDAGITDSGRSLRMHVEQRTDTAVMDAYRHLPDAEDVLAALVGVADVVSRSGEASIPGAVGVGAR